ncbi:MAG: ATP-binding protein [Bacteroidota bacterium]
MDLSELRSWVRRGEGLHVEFKKKAKFPDKIAREAVAFANTKGGKIFVGVSDDGLVEGNKIADGEAYVLEKYFAEHCIPALPIQFELVPVTSSRKVVVVHVRESKQKPHFLKIKNGRKQAFVRVDDMSIGASREMTQVIRLQQRKKGGRLIFGERERKLLQALEELQKISLEETAKLLEISRRKASQLLIILVRTGLLHIHPSEKGDFFTLAEEAFSEG